MFRQFCHHQGVTYCLAKITIYIIVRIMRSLYYGYVATCLLKTALSVHNPQRNLQPDDTI